MLLIISVIFFSIIIELNFNILETDKFFLNFPQCKIFKLSFCISFVKSIENLEPVTWNQIMFFAEISRSKIWRKNLLIEQSYVTL